jgi:Protein of unknown function (DUF4230)
VRHLTPSQIFVLGLLVILGIGAWLGVSRLMMPYAVEREDRIALSQVVSATFSKAASLKVGTLTGTVQATAADSRLAGWLQSDSVMRAPYSVDYMLDLSKLTLADYQWNAGDRVLTVRVPDVATAPPNIDEAKMTVQRRGVFITRDAFDAMGRTASTRAGRIASDKAKSAAMMAKARENARAAVSHLLKGPLAAAGLPKVTVAVRFATEGNTASERWDESRSLAQVLKDKSR